MKETVTSLLIAATLAFSCVPLASAELLFNNYTPEIEPITSGPSPYTVGAEFTVGAQAVAVTKLGVFAGTGVFQDTPVGIWSVSDQSLVGSAVITSNAAANVVRIQDWYMVDVTPFTLAANGVYRIGTQNMGSDLGWGGTFQPGSGIASVSPGSVWSPLPDWSAPDPFYGQTFMYPTGYYPDDPFIASANAEIAPVPEPAEWTMLLAGLLVVGFIARRRNTNLS